MAGILKRLRVMKLTSVWPSTAAHYCAVKTANVSAVSYKKGTNSCLPSCGNRAAATTTITTAYTTGYPTAYMTANLT